MSLAAIGCNPDFRWTIVSSVVAGDNPDHAQPVGTLAYSPSGGLFVAVQAGNTIAANLLATIEAGFRARSRDSADAVKGCSMGATTAIISNNEYGWVQVWGMAELRADDAVTAGGGLSLDTTEEGELIPAGTANSPGIAGAVAVDAISANGVGTVQLTFPLLIKNA